ncbi:hypothetical protein V8G54_015636 [Vigna mungo]|uniref:Uncharacterized protein n=1 Tax=Vigna mungo TaxID=3915 RepID=A0AAQ3NLM5_VIGMU
MDVQHHLTQCRRKWHALLSDYDRFKRTTTIGGKLSPNFDYQLFAAVEHVLRAREERGMADPESDTEAGNDALDTATMEIGSKREGERSKFRHRIQKPKSKSEGVAEQVMSGIETVRVVDVATLAKERELLEALKDIRKERSQFEKVPGLDGMKITDIATGAEHSVIVTGKITLPTALAGINISRVDGRVSADNPSSSTSNRQVGKKSKRAEDDNGTEWEEAPIADLREVNLEKVPGLDGMKITDIATGAEHSVIVTGKVYSFRS